MKNDDAYANSAYIPEADRFLNEWPTLAEDFRIVEATIGRARLNISYGEHPRQQFDLFLPSGKPLGLLIFVHGGYWRMLDRGYFSHFAEGAVEEGWAVAVPGYVLTPEVEIANISKMIGTAISAAAEMVPGPIALCGHSAGGHLVARMATGISTLSEDASNRIRCIVPISPLSDLRPLIETSMNTDLNLTMEKAKEESPALKPKQLNANVHIWVGSDERPAFLDQARWLAQSWDAELTIEEDRHHFDIIEGLRDPNHRLLQTLISDPSQSDI